MKKRMNLCRSLCLLMALLMAVGIGLPVRANAEAPVEIHAGAEEEQNKTVLTDLRITGLSAPQPGQPFPAQATVVSAEGISWQIPVLWTDANGIPVSGIAGEGPYFPVLVFFVPAEYAVRGSNGKIGSFQLTVDPSVLALFGTDNLFSVYDADRGITYILNGKTNAAVVQREESIMPSEPVPGLPEKFQAPKDGYRNPRYIGPVTEEETEAPEEVAGEPIEPAEAPMPAPAEEPVNPAPAEEAPLPAPAEAFIPEIVTIHCSKTATDAMDTQDLAKLVDLIKYRLQPQAVELLRTSFPAYDEASQNNQLGSQIGLYIFYEKGDKDGIDEHEGIVEGSYASVMAGYEDREDGSAVYKYILELNARSFIETDEQKNPILDDTGKARLTTKESDLADLEATIIHEMMHAFMDDYNRSGMSGVLDPSVMGYGGGAAQQIVDANEHMKRVGFPGWFLEGLAVSIESNYRFRLEAFNLLSYADPGVFNEWYTPENLKKAYTTTSFRVDPNQPDVPHYFELETGEKGINGNPEEKSLDARYVTGYLACLYLAELAANREGRTSKYAGADGYTALDSSVLRDGVNTILKRLHEGETLDAVIEDISSGTFADTTDFEQNFIKGSDHSADFCTDFLNHMRSLAQDETREFLPSGSILFPFDSDYSGMFDRTKDGESNLYRIVDSNRLEESTADMSYVTDAGRSLSYNDYVAELRIVEEEKAKLTAQTEIYNAIADEVAPGESLNATVYEYIMNAVFEAQIVDEETRQTILETAKKMQAELTADAAEQAAEDSFDTSDDVFSDEYEESYPGDPAALEGDGDPNYYETDVDSGDESDVQYEESYPGDPAALEGDGDINYYETDVTWSDASDWDDAAGWD